MSDLSFTLAAEFIELFKLLKLTGLCDSGGSAKYAVSQNLVKVNGEVETRKAFKVRRGQRVEYIGRVIIVQ